MGLGVGDVQHGKVWGWHWVGVGVGGGGWEAGCDRHQRLRIERRARPGGRGAGTTRLQGRGHVLRLTATSRVSTVRNWSASVCRISMARMLRTGVARCSSKSANCVDSIRMTNGATPARALVTRTERI